jgi:hypothetical protein
MSAELSYKTAVCTEYERLLLLCQKSLESWRNQREEFIRFGLRGKKVADELLRLQTHYARAYSRLLLHEVNCEICRVVSKISGRNNTSILNAISDKQPSA